jgi:hypothetical protein
MVRLNLLFTSCVICSLKSREQESFVQLGFIKFQFHHTYRGYRGEVAQMYIKLQRNDGLDIWVSMDQSFPMNYEPHDIWIDIDWCK